MAHGTYQDTWNRPDGWSFAIFPNDRNVVWSCCWWPESKPGWVEFGVRNYQAPVAISNGWGDNLGFAELSAARREQVRTVPRAEGAPDPRGLCAATDEQWVSALTRLIDDAVLRRSMGASGLVYVRRIHEREMLADRLAEILREVVG